MTWLHRDDCPNSIDIILAVRDGRDVPGITPAPNGLDVDWDAVFASYLSTTEMQAMRLAQALAPMERHGGGYSEEIARAIRAAVAAVVGG